MMAPVTMKSPATKAGTFDQLLWMEWTKLRATLFTRWVLALGCGLTIGIAVAQSLELRAGASPEDLAQIGSGGVVGVMVMAGTVVPFFTIVLGALTITGEYSSGMIRTTLVAVPQRGRLLAAKGTVLAVTAWAFGAFVTVACWLTAGLIIPTGFDADSVTTIITIASNATWAMSAAVMTYGFGTASRSTAAAIVLSLAMIFLMSSLVPLISTDLAVMVVPYMVEDASSVLLTGEGAKLPARYGRPTALLVVLGWAAVAYAAGYGVLKRRDV